MTTPGVEVAVVLSWVPCWRLASVVCWMDPLDPAAVPVTLTTLLLMMSPSFGELIVMVGAPTEGIPAERRNNSTTSIEIWAFIGHTILNDIN
jgi:hypothetical protein